MLALLPAPPPISATKHSQFDETEAKQTNTCGELKSPLLPLCHSPFHTILPSLFHQSADSESSNPIHFPFKVQLSSTYTQTVNLV